MIQVRDPIVSNLRGEMARRGINGDEMSERMCISKGTFYKRLNNPEEFTVGELRMASKFLKMSLEDLIRRRA